MRDYELVLIVSPEVTEEDLGKVTEKVSQWVTGGGGEVSNVNPWGRRRMAYSIKGFGEGSYVAIRFRGTPGALPELERSLKLAEEIIRYSLVRLGV